MLTIVVFKARYCNRFAYRSWHFTLLCNFNLINDQIDKILRLCRVEHPWQFTVYDFCVDCVDYVAPESAVVDV